MRGTHLRGLKAGRVCLFLSGLDEECIQRRARLKRELLANGLRLDWQRVLVCVTVLLDTASMGHGWYMLTGLDDESDLEGNLVELLTGARFNGRDW